MLWIHKYRRVWRGVILALLLLAIIGPWFFDQIIVPAEYPCSFRLEGDYCGIPTSGTWILAALAGELINIVVALFTGAAVLAALGRLLQVTLVVFFSLLPVISTLLLVLPGERRGLQVIPLAAWGLVAAASLWLLLSVPELPQRVLWGFWLYIGLAPGALVLEVAALVVRRRSGRPG